mmetsp:Transcript_90001/g.244079  ORF Transcript_90001/g.244079 Transcript_90001/m.244079 type:complete len:257 (+) Transcript_90001:660-1430(+)
MKRAASATTSARRCRSRSPSPSPGDQPKLSSAGRISAPATAASNSSTSSGPPPPPLSPTYDKARCREFSTRAMASQTCALASPRSPASRRSTSTAGSFPALASAALSSSRPIRSATPTSPRWRAETSESRSAGVAYSTLYGATCPKLSFSQPELPRGSASDPSPRPSSCPDGAHSPLAPPGSSGTCHTFSSSPGSSLPSARNHRCRTDSWPRKDPDSPTVSRGKPCCSVHDCIMARTGWSDTSSQHDHRSAESVLP